MPTHSPVSTASVATSLEPPETNPPHCMPTEGGICDEPPDLGELFRHAGWHRTRGLVYASLRRTRQSLARIDAFVNCGVNSYVYRSSSDPPEYRLGGSACHDRFCLPCAKYRGSVIAGNILDYLKGKGARFVTLTLKQEHAPLSQTLDRLLSCFAYLRKTAFWRSKVYGGCALLEIKLNSLASTWNVHLHALVTGKYLPQHDLSDVWRRVTGDSSIVDVRAVRSDAVVTRYVVKYVSKPLSNSFVNRPAYLDEAVQALHGRRLALTFGSWRGLSLSEAPTEGTWECIGSFHEVCSHAVDGDPESLEALQFICGDCTPDVLEKTQSARPPPRPVPPTEPQLRFDWLTHLPPTRR